MDNTFNHIDDLLGKYLAGEASREEQQEVMKWINTNEANRRYFDQMYMIFERARTVKAMHDFDADAAWVKMKNNLKKSPAKTVVFPAPNKSLWYLKVAASVAVVLMTGYAILRWAESPHESVALKSGSKVLQDTLPDGSVAFLNKKSTVNYSYSKGKRRVEVSGEVYFDVRHEEQKPFIIHTGNVIIEDIGTTFNVQAYPDSTTVEVFVESGEVAFYTEENAGLHLTKGERGIYDKRSQSFVKRVASDTNILAYKTRIFNFYNADLGTIVADLNAVYETKIRLAHPELESCRLNVSFKGEPIEVIADIISETLSLEVTKTEREIILDGSGCGERQ